PVYALNSRGYRTSETPHDFSRRISDREDDGRRFLFLFGAQVGAAGQRNRTANTRGRALGFLAPGLPGLQRFLQIVSEGGPKGRVLSRVERLTLETLSASAQRLRLDVHKRVLHRKQRIAFQHLGRDQTQRCIVVEDVDP